MRMHLFVITFARFKSWLYALSDILSSCFNLGVFSPVVSRYEKARRRDEGIAQQLREQTDGNLEQLTDCVNCDGRMGITCTEICDMADNAKWTTQKGWQINSEQQVLWQLRHLRNYFALNSPTLDQT